MRYKILADAVVFIHFLWIVFLVFGVFWGARNRRVKIFHVSGLLFAFLIQIFGWYCPLTHLEVWLRARHDPSLAYSGSFIVYYLAEVIYIRVSKYLVLILTVLLCVFSVCFYLRGNKKVNQN